MTREEAYQTLLKFVKNENLIKHHLACEIVMKALYRKLTPLSIQNPIDEEKWGIVGLLHDADYEQSKNHPEKHTLILEKKIGKDLPADIMYAIKSHNMANNGVEPKSAMDWSIYCCDELTGLIIAATLVNPEKKLMAVTPEFVMNRFNESSFAKGASRAQIRTCETKLMIPLKEFIEIALLSMQSIDKSLGL
ncbi:MAG: phosphohydrolase [Patescibacteria group bacterium]|nr:phosphohydrolase [Patescibacteria group bacterium]